MAVIAALDRERQFYAERIEHVRQPRPERDDDLAGIERAGRRIDAPMRIDAMQRARIAGKRQAAERRKARGIGARQRQRIAHAHRAGPMHGVTEHRRKRWFERARRVAIERDIGDAERCGKIELALEPGKRAARCDRVSASRCGADIWPRRTPSSALHARQPRAQTRAASLARFRASRSGCDAARKAKSQGAIFGKNAR